VFLKVEKTCGTALTGRFTYLVTGHL
jgi:hypothetical protein